MGAILQSGSHRLGGLFYARLLGYPQVFDALVDDNRQHAELVPVTFSRDPQGWGSVIRLEDV
jgi:hypothetical protein